MFLTKPTFNDIFLYLNSVVIGSKRLLHLTYLNTNVCIHNNGKNWHNAMLNDLLMSLTQWVLKPVKFLKPDVLEIIILPNEWVSRFTIMAHWMHTYVNVCWIYLNGSWDNCFVLV